MKAALRDPKNVSTIFPSLKYLALSLIEQSGMKEGHNVLELGCGSGAITKHILAKQDSLAAYVGVEIDKQLVQFLRTSYPGTQFLDASADDLKASVADASIDTVICSLPWTLFPQELQESIIKEILRVLKPGGQFTTFLCLHSLTYPGAPRIKKLFSQHFSKFEKRVTITRNIPPANVYWGQK